MLFAEDRVVTVSTTSAYPPTKIFIRKRSNRRFTIKLLYRRRFVAYFCIRYHIDKYMFKNCIIIICTYRVKKMKVRKILRIKLEIVMFSNR